MHWECMEVYLCHNYIIIHTATWCHPGDLTLVGLLYGIELNREQTLI